MAYALSTRSKDRLKGVLPIMVAAFDAAIKHPECPFDFGIPSNGGLRTTEEQQALFAQGRSVGRKVLPIVTNADGVVNKSNHQKKSTGFGHAIDIYIFNGETKEAEWDKAKLTAVARHIQKVALEVFKLKVEWAGDWKTFKELPHFEVKELPENWKEFTEVSATTPKTKVATKKPVTNAK